MWLFTVAIDQEQLKDMEDYVSCRPCGDRCHNYYYYYII